MKVAIIHTDFRIYWPFRLRSLHEFLKQFNIDLKVIEIAGFGGPYNFNYSSSDIFSYWKILFPERKIEDIPINSIKKKLSEELNKITPDIIIAGALAFPSGAISLQWVIKNKKKIILFDDARLEDVPRNFLINSIKKNIYKNVDAIFCPSPDWKLTFNYFGFNNEQLFYGVNIVDNNFWSTSSKKEENDSLPERYFLTVGRMIPKKNFYFLLNAYEYYSRIITDPISLVLVGDGPEKEKLVQYSTSKKLKNVYFKPFLTQEKLRYIYQNADLFILPSKYGETWGLVVNEAMAAGLPVLLSKNVGCAKSLVKDGQNGFLFSAEDKFDLISKLIKIHNLNQNELKAMGQKSKAIICEWDIKMFNSNILEALKFVNSRKNTRINFFSKTLANFWNGRYNPL